MGIGEWIALVHGPVLRQRKRRRLPPPLLQIPFFMDFSPKAVLDYIIEHMQAELDTCRAVIGSWDRACVLQSEIKLFTDLRDEWQRAFAHQLGNLRR